MSGLICALALRSRLPNSQKLVMLALGDQANDYGENCFPGLELIMQLSSLSRRTVFTVLAELEGEGYITRVPVGVQRVGYVIHVGRLRQSELPLPSERTRDVPRSDQCKSRTGANLAPVQTASKTGANFAPYKSTHNSTQENISPGARAADDRIGLALVGQFEGHDNPQCSTEPAGTEAGRIAADLRRRGFRITSQHPDLIAAIAEGVTLAHVAEFSDLYPAEHPKCRGSPGYVLAACRRQLAQPAEVSTHATHSQPRESAVERVRRNIVAAEQREAASVGQYPHADLVVADG